MNNYAKIRKMDISNGPGVRVSLFVQGCPFHCKNCFNSETWNPEGGKPFTEAELKLLMDLCAPEYIDGLSILGGEPLWKDASLEMTTAVAKEFKTRYPKKSLWLWTGFKWEQVKDLPIMKYVDVVVDGQFIEGCADPTLKWRGSSNQRIIDVKTQKEMRDSKFWQDSKNKV